MATARKNGAANARFERCLAVVLKHEGGFSDHPKDPGGPTNYGITRKTLASWRGVGEDDVSADAVKHLAMDEVRLIYLARYWTPIRGDELPPGVDLAVFDYAVNSGVRQASRALQKVVGATVDGVIGRQTLAAVRRRQAEDVIREVCDSRVAFLRGLQGWDTFGRGWKRRVEEVERTAMRWAKEKMPLADVAKTDTGKAATATAGMVAAAAVAVEEMKPLLEAAGPWVSAYGGYGLLVVLASVVVFGVWQWRAKRA